MIKTLYPIFQKWSEKGSIYFVSDTMITLENVRPNHA